MFQQHTFYVRISIFYVCCIALHNTQHQISVQKTENNNSTQFKPKLTTCHKMLVHNTHIDNSFVARTLKQQEQQLSNITSTKPPAIIASARNT